ncbi:PAS domain-containing protein [Candidatus Sumerlaeota bacterium]|nr:PAS domain-containing protein [Candidatus Sumerlaeota bacterium]
MALSSFFEQVLENIPDGITVQDREYNIIYQNKAMKQAFGDRVGEKCYFSYERREQICEGCGLRKAFETGKPTLVHRTGVTEDEAVSHWENNCFPLFDDKGEIVGGVEVCRDVTDRVSLAQEVRDRSIELGKLNDQLLRKGAELEDRTQELEAAYHELQQTHTHLLHKEKMASIGQLAAGIAHEINTPIHFMGNNITFLRNSFEELISVMQQCLEKLASAVEDSSDLSKLHTDITALFDELDLEYLKEEIPLAMDQTANGAKRVAEIVQAMKSFASSGGTALQPVELDDLIRSTVEITHNAWKFVAELKVELVNPPLIVKGQKGDLGQVLLNLIMNAVEAIAVKQQPGKLPGRIHIKTRRKDGWGEIIVEDSGCGIEPSLQKRIFEPFFTTKDVGRGSGQGLAIAYSIINEHGGELLVDSEPGQGSAFTIRLRLSESP